MPSKKSINKTSENGTRLFFAVVLMLIAPIFLSIIVQASAWAAIVAIVTAILGISFAIAALILNKQTPKKIFLVCCIVWFIYMGCAGIFTLIVSGAGFLG